jgi:energy-coupling factor transport system substrate-specific component
MKVETKREKTLVLTVMAMALAINLVSGRFISSLIPLVFLDTVGTAMAGILLGPVYGIISGIAYGLLGFVLGDPFEFYFCGSAILVGWLCGVFFYKKKYTIPSVFWKVALISVPGSIITAILITVFFGGITTSVTNNLFIGFMRSAGFSLFQSALAMQLIQDYLDKIVSVGVMLIVVKHLPSNIKDKF